MKIFSVLKYDSITRFGDVVVMQNSEFLPLGFTYNRYIPLSNFRLLSSDRKDITMQAAFVAEEPIDERIMNLDLFDLKDTAKIYVYNDYFKELAELREDTLEITGYSENRITGSIEVQEPKVLFLSIPFDRGWQCKIDGEGVEPFICNIGFTGLYITPGRHMIELKYTPPYFTASLLASILGLLIYFGLLFHWVRHRKKHTALKIK